MTTPRIEEIVGELDDRLSSLDCDNYGECYVDNNDRQQLCDWLRTTITQAHQAWIDEAVERVNQCIEIKSDHEIWINPQKLDDTIKALQNNK